MNAEELYRPGPENTLVIFEDIRSEHMGRVVEYRDPITTAGQRGELGDAIAYLINDAGILRFKGVSKGIIVPLGTVVMFYPEGWQPAAPKDSTKSEPTV